jgi:hypothetical protein
VATSKSSPLWIVRFARVEASLRDTIIQWELAPGAFFDEADGCGKDLFAGVRASAAFQPVERVGRRRNKGASRFVRTGPVLWINCPLRGFHHGSHLRGAVLSISTFLAADNEV